MGDGLMVRVSARINAALSAAFERLGRFNGRRPWLVVAFSLLLTAALGSGLFCCFTQESDPTELFVPQGTRSIEDKKDVLLYYGEESRFVGLLLVPKEGTSWADKTFLLAALDFFQDLTAITGEADGSTYTLADLCEEPSASAVAQPQPGIPTCVSSVLSLWGYSAARLTADPSFTTTINLFLPASAQEFMFGGTTRDAENRITDLEVMIMAANLRVNYTVNEDGEKEDLPAEAWEDELVALVTGDVDTGGDPAHWGNFIEVYPQTARSFEEEIGGAILGDVGIVSASYFIIIIYVIVAMQHRCTAVGSSFTVSFSAMATIGLGIVTSFGLCQFLGFKYGNTHSVLPFIVIGVGADGCFIVVNAFTQTKISLPLEERAGIALGHAGVSLTVSSLTNVFAFAIGSLTAIPDLASFGKYASFSLLFLWFYLCTFYTAVLVLNERRMAANRVDILCCIHGKPDPEMHKSKPSWLQRFMRKKYAPLVVSKWFRSMVILLALVFVAVCGFKASELEVQATGKNFIPDGSYLRTYFDLLGKYFGGSPTDVQVIIEEFDIDRYKVELVGLGDKYRCDGCEANPPRIIPSFSYWLEDFIADVQTSINEGGNATGFMVDPSDFVADEALDGQFFPASTALFYSYLTTWVDETTTGANYASDLVFKDASRSALARARVRMQHTPIGSYDEEGEFNADAAAIVKAVDKMYEISDSFPFGVYPYSFKYTDDWAAFDVIGEELVRNTVSALGTVLLVVTVLIGHLGASLLVFFSTVFTVVEILGMNAFIGLSVDTVVTVLVVLSVGLAVDYSAHNVYSFMLHTGTREERVIKMLADIGVPVVNGAVSTFLAVMLQSLSSSYVFVVVFYEFFFAILFGALNGLVLVPAVLSVIGPAPYATARPDEEEDDLKKDNNPSSGGASVNGAAAQA